MSDLSSDMPGSAHAFSMESKAAIYEVMYRRRDIRHFRPEPLPEETLAVILQAAHHAPSVGFMQPWNFVLIREQSTKEQVSALFEQENALAATVYNHERQQLYRRLKLAGILESPLNLCVTCDPTRGGPHVLGRHTIRETDVYSTAAAVGNLWLAARAEGVGVGWVSILNNEALKRILQLPSHIIPVAYLCLGYVDSFGDEPELQKVGWAQRLPLASLVYYEQWGQQSHPNWTPLPFPKDE